MVMSTAIKVTTIYLAVKEAYEFFIKRTNIIFIVAINIVII